MEIPRHLPNRFMIGTAYTEVQTGTLGMGLDQRQAAQLPYGGDLVQSDATQERLCQAIIDTALCWDEGTPDSRGYTVRMSSFEPVGKGKVEPGMLQVMPEMLARNFVISITTSHETAQDRQLAEQAAERKFQLHKITDIELYEAYGYDDPYEHQREVFEHENWVQHVEPIAQQATTAACIMLLAATTGMDIQSLLGAGQPSQPQSNPPTQSGPEIVQPPAVGNPTTGSGVTVG